MANAVDHYLAALREQDWDALESTLADGVHRTGPYRDVVEGRRPYREFLDEQVSRLANYELRVHRVDVIGGPADPGRTVWVRLSESMDTPEGRSRTEEALEFALDTEGKIARVAVFLQKTELLSDPGES